MARHILSEAPPRATGLAPGTIIFTLEGALPVEYLSPGDRIITRAGMRVLRDLRAGSGGFALHFDQPEVVYADGVETHAA